MRQKKTDGRRKGAGACCRSDLQCRERGRETERGLIQALRGARCASALLHTHNTHLRRHGGRPCDGCACEEEVDACGCCLPVEARRGAHKDGATLLLLPLPLLLALLLAQQARRPSRWLAITTTSLCVSP